MKPLTLACCFLPAAVAAVVACGPSGSSKTDLIVCQAGQGSCPSDQAITGHKPPGSGGSESTPSDPAPAAPPATPNTPAPAATPTVVSPGPSDGGTTPPATLGPSCVQLKGCCDAMSAVGIFADFCNEAVATGNESTCTEKYQSYINDPENAVCF